MKQPKIFLERDNENVILPTLRNGEMINKLLRI